MTYFEFLIPRRPISLHTRNREYYQGWKRFVAGEAHKVWGNRPAIRSGDLHLQLVYLSRRNPPDLDNIIKPIQDALVGLVMHDDSLVADVECHRRAINGTFFELPRLPPLLLQGLIGGAECVYVRLSDTEPLEDLL
ncbi:MAG TPA: RusA family crossover junction endodeoxyribonuclease [Longimicrobium sp.]